MAKDTFWFPHDCNASDDDKTMILIDQLGLEGYGIYWVLIEKLREREDFKMPFNTIPIIARRYGTTAEKMKTVVTQFDLFEYDENGFFFSQSLVNRMQKWIDKKEKLSIAGKISAQKRLKTQTNVQQMSNKCSTDAQQMFNKCSTIIEEKRIEENITEDNIREDSKNEAHASLTHTPQQVEILTPYETECTSIVPKEKGKGMARARNRSLEEREQDFYNSLIPHLAEYGSDMIRDFFNYWSEPNQQKTKMKFELQKTWAIKGRLATWNKNQSKFENNGFKTKREVIAEQQSELQRGIAANFEKMQRGISSYDEEWANNVPI